MSNNRMKNLMQSEIRNMSIECDKLGGINLSQGICDLPLTKVLEDGVKEALLEEYNHYTRYDGISELREAIANKARHFNGIKADPEKNVTVSCGATGALYATCISLFSPGDEVILFEPFYGYHEYTFLATDLVPVYVRLTPPEWSFDISELEAKVTPRTKAIMINTPANPCGKVFTEAELEVLGDFCIRHDLIILTDEIYEYITYDNNKHVSPASIEKISDRVITIGGYSKTFSITGWRIGYSIAPEKYSSLIGMANDLIYVCAPAPLQYAVARAINTLDDAFYTQLRSDYTVKRSIICSALSKGGLTPYIPQGAYYVLADISRLPGENSKEKCMYLLNEYGIAAVPGESFYNNSGGKTLARFCFAKSDEILKTAAQRLADIN